jgi:hypothetical protein
MTGQDCYPTCPTPPAHLRPLPPLQHFEAPARTLAVTGGGHMADLVLFGVALIAGGVVLARAVNVNWCRPPRETT